MSPTNLIYFTCSFDDGDIADLRLADLMHKYNIRGTFYIPQSCNLVKKSLDDAQIKHISDRFEIGGHTINHVVLNEIENHTAQAEIDNCKKWLEDVTGKTIDGFCPPRGKFKQEHIAMIKNSGFTILRTVEMLQTKKIERLQNSEMIILPTTVQVFNHTISSYLKNITKRFNLTLFKQLTQTYNNNWNRMATNQMERLQRQADFKKPGFNYFHLWGHSWEIEKYNLWNELEEFFNKINSSTNIISCTNSELAFSMRNFKTI